MEKNILFNQKLRERSFKLAVDINILLQQKKSSSNNRSMVNQLLRSSSSVGANFSSASRARSGAEFYSKICIVTEECDEVIYWLRYLIAVGHLTEKETKAVLDEAEELIRIFASIKSKLKQKQ